MHCEGTIVLDAIIPLVVLIILIAESVSLFELNAINGSLQVALLLSTMVVLSLSLRMAIPGMKSVRREVEGNSESDFSK